MTGPVANANLDPFAAHSQNVTAGGNPVTVQAARTGKNNADIDLDSDKYKNLDPAEALQKAFLEKTQLPFDPTLKNFTLKKGFDKDNQGSIELHAYRNPPGPECYYLTRTWKVTYEKNGKLEDLTFSKKIYTSVEIPLKAEGHTQKQYMAALAARTYANIVESMIKHNAGQTDELYNSISTHMSKIAKDRFVTMEMYNGDRKVTINPKESLVRKNKMENQMITTVVLNIRAGNKRENEVLKNDPTKNKTKIENESDAYPQIHLVDFVSRKNKAHKAEEFYSKSYVLKADTDSSNHVKEMAVLLKSDDIVNAVRGDENLSPEQACYEAGVDLNQFKEVSQNKLNESVSEFYQTARFFSVKKEIPALMENFGRDPNVVTIQEQTLSILPPKVPTGWKEKIQAPFKKENISLNKPEILSAIVDLAENSTLTRIQQTDLSNLVKSYKKAHKELESMDKKISKIEADCEKMGMPVDAKQTGDRKKTLKTIDDLLKKAEAALPNAKVKADPTQTESEEESNLENEDSGSQGIDLDSDASGTESLSSEETSSKESKFNPTILNSDLYEDLKSESGEGK